jgi:release factor glutamine methyltransferase
MTTVDSALAFARKVGVERLDATLLLAHHLERSRAWLLAHPDAALDAAVQARFEDDCRRRADDVPLAYLTGVREFRGLALNVGPAVLVPRPDTETLADWAIEVIKALPATPRPRVVDLGTGSGALALAMAAACPHADVTATDASESALAVAAGNAQRLGLSVRWRCGDWWQAVAGESFDLVVSNPPYVSAADPHLHALRHEPREALVAGDDGLAALRRIISHARPSLSGWLLLEHGWDQADAVQKLLSQAGFTRIDTRCDLNGKRRCTGARLP